MDLSQYDPFAIIFVVLSLAVIGMVGSLLLLRYVVE